ncbi:MAG: thioredoxin family protein [Gammaproteobacteria bacterium]|nr:thioredoxin family protein [Gammaproteobacteria bacterium]
MALTPSNMLALGTVAPDFSLPDTQGNTVTLADFQDSPALVVAFICNHCPFVKHIRPQIAALADDYLSKGVAFVAINSNDIEAFPDDNMEHMQKEAEDAGYHFPYLLDESQTIAKAYDAACTPDFYLFGQDSTLVYRGQLDRSRPGNDIPVSGEDLRAALDKVLAGETVPEEQIPSVGCNIKWKPGNEPD